MHGAMTAQERSNKVLKIVQDWKIDMEEKHDKPFEEIRPSALPAVSRDKLADLLGMLKRQNVRGTRGKCNEARCEGARNVCDTIAGDLVGGSIEE